MRDSESRHESSTLSLGAMTIDLSPQRYDLALLARGFPISDIKRLAAEMVAFARRPSIHPMGEITGGRELGFDAEVIQAMQDRWEITQADLDAINDGLGWTE